MFLPSIHDVFTLCCPPPVVRKSFPRDGAAMITEIISLVESNHGGPLCYLIRGLTVPDSDWLTTAGHLIHIN